MDNTIPNVCLLHCLKSEKITPGSQTIIMDCIQGHVFRNISIFAFPKKYSAALLINRKRFHIVNSQKM